MAPSLPQLLAASAFFFSNAAVIFSMVVLISASTQKSVISDLHWGSGQSETYDCGFFCGMETTTFFVSVQGMVEVIGDSYLSNKRILYLYDDCSDADVCDTCRRSFRCSYALACAFFAVSIVSCAMGWMRLRKGGLVYKTLSIVLTLIPVCLGIPALVIFSNQCMSEIKKSYNKPAYGPFALFSSAICSQFVAVVFHSLARTEMSNGAPVGNTAPAVQMRSRPQYSQLPVLSTQAVYSKGVSPVMAECVNVNQQDSVLVVAQVVPEEKY